MDGVYGTRSGRHATAPKDGFTMDGSMKHGRVILADRNQDMLEGIRGLLETSFDTVLMVADVNSLFTAAEKLPIDLVVVDFSLPVSSGVNIVRQLKRRFPDLKLIVLSIHDEQTVRQEVLAAGAEGFVLKRSAATDLIPAVRAVIAGRKYISSSSGKYSRSDRHGTLKPEQL